MHHEINYINMNSKFIPEYAVLIVITTQGFITEAFCV